MAKTTARAIGFFALGLIVVMGMGATLTWAQSGDLSPPLHSPPPIVVPTSPPTYPPPSSLAPPPLPQRNATLAACLDSYPELSIGARLVKDVPTAYQFNSSATEMTLLMPTNEAFIAFAASLRVNLTEDSADIDNLPYPNTWRQAFRYHMIPERVDFEILKTLASILKIGTDKYPTDLGKDAFARLNMTVYNKAGDGNAAKITVYGTSSSANVLQYDIKCGNSTLYIIDTVLQYWYADLEAALSLFNIKLRDSLIQTGLMSVLANLNGTIFAPSDWAFTTAQDTYGYDFNTSVDTLKYHVVPSQQVPIQQTVVQKADYMTLNSKALQVNTFGNSSRPMVSTWITGGVKTIIAQSAVPVGVEPTFNIYQIDAVLIPTYTDIGQALNNENFKKLQTLVAAESGVSDMLGRRSQDSMTLFAPTDQALRAYVTKAYGSNADVSPGVFKDKLKNTLNNHVVRKAYSFQALLDLAKVEAAIDAVNGKLWLNSSVTVRTEHTSADVVAPNNISVLYGKSYIHAINYVLSPYSDSNGSGTAAPSLLALGLSLLVARLLAAVQ